VTLAAQRRIVRGMDQTSSETAGPAPAAEVREISREEIERRLGDPAMLLVDVLPREAYAAEHIPGAINLPLAEVEERAPGMLPDRGADIITYCAKFT
jgi:rhodanese-related sulfurtransferase